MEIISLNNEDLKKDNKNKSDEALLSITDLKQGVKNPNRVNVFINGKYSFSLDLTQVVDFKLKIGKEITNQQLLEYKKASEFGKLYQRTLEWVLIRPRAEKEIRDYLFRKLRKSSSGTFRSRPSSRGSLTTFAPAGAQVSSEDISELSDNILKRLLARGYVDDRRFAEFYVENRFVKKGISRKRLQMELMKKGVAREIIDEVLEVRNDETEILKVITKKRSKYDDDKLIQYLCRQGFDYQLVQNLVQNYEKD